MNTFLAVRNPIQGVVMKETVFWALFLLEDFILGVWSFWGCLRVRSFFPETSSLGGKAAGAGGRSPEGANDPDRA